MKKLIHTCQLMILLAVLSKPLHAQNKGNLNNLGGWIPDTTWIDLDGTDDFLDFGTDNIVAGQTQFTVEMRIHFDNSTGDYTIIGQRTNDGNRTIVLQRWAGAFYVFLSNTNYGSCSFVPCTGTIYHLAIVYDGTGVTNSDKIKLYINGDLQILTFTGTIDNTSYVTSPAANLVLGCEHNGPATQLQYVNGQIGEFCVWNYPLTQSEINSRLLSEVYSGAFGLIEYFHFDNGIPGGNNTGISIFAGGKSISNIVPTNMTMNGSSSNFISTPTLVNPIDTSITVFGSVLASNANGAAYQWLDCNNNDAPIPGATSQSYNAPSVGNYSVQITLGSCIDTSFCNFVSTVGINVGDAKAENISIYPNPASTQLRLLCPWPINKISIVDLAGRVVYQKADIGAERKVAIHHLLPGIYFINVVVEGITVSRKFIKDVN